MQAQCYEAERSLFLQPVAEAVRAVALALPPAGWPWRPGTGGTLAELVRSCGGCWTWKATSALRPSWSGGGRSRRSPPSSAGWPPAGNAARSSTTSTWPAPRPWSCFTLLRRLAGDRVLVLAAVRAEEGAETLAALADVGRMLELGPLPAAAVAELAGASAWPTWLARCRSGPGATPCSRWRACGRRPRAAVTGPPSRRARQRSTTVSPGPARWGPAAGAVVVGATFDLEVVAALLGRGRARPGRRLLVEDPSGSGYAFVNDLVREVLYKTNPGRPASPATAAGAFASRDAERLLGQAVAAAAEAGDPALEASARLARAGSWSRSATTPGAFADRQRALELAATSGDDRLEAEALEQLRLDVYLLAASAYVELTPRRGSWSSGP